MTRRAPAARLIVAAAVSAFLFAFSARAETAFEKVSVPGFRGSTPALDGYLAKPAGAGPFPAVVLMHGCSGLLTRSGRVQTNMAAWMRRLVDWGHVALALDGFAPRGVREICTLKDRPISEFRERPRDAYAGLAFVSGLPFVAAERVALAGWSNGAMATLAAVARHMQSALGNPSPGFRAAIAFYPGCVRMRREGFRSTVPLGLFLGGADDWTPSGPCLAMAAAARGDGAPVTATAYPGAYHGFDHPSSKVRTRKVRNPAWREESREIHIGADPAARAASIEGARAFLARELAAP